MCMRYHPVCPHVTLQTSLQTLNAFWFEKSIFDKALEFSNNNAEIGIKVINTTVMIGMKYFGFLIIIKLLLQL